MKPTTITLVAATAAAQSDPVKTDRMARAYSLSFGTSGNTTGFTAQYTLTPARDFASMAAWAAAAVWHDVTEIAAATANAASQIVGPVEGIRLACNASGTDTGTLQIITELS